MIDSWSNIREPACVVAVQGGTGEIAGGGEPDANWLNPHRKVVYVAKGKPGLIDVIDVSRCEVAERGCRRSKARTLLPSTPGASGYTSFRLALRERQSTRRLDHIEVVSLKG